MAIFIQTVPLLYAGNGRGACFAIQYPGEPDMAWSRSDSPTEALTVGFVLFLPQQIDGGGIPRTAEGKVDYSHDFFARQAFLTVSGQLQVWFE
jgi:hypothetical protein